MIRSFNIDTEATVEKESIGENVGEKRRQESQRPGSLTRERGTLYAA